MRTQKIRHFGEVDVEAIKADFDEKGEHRFSLHIPFKSRATNRVLCVIGQNPSDAGLQFADRTVRYLEELAYSRPEGYGAMCMLNLYTRVDRRKQFEDVDSKHRSWEQPIAQAAARHEDLLVVYGQLRNQGNYRFRDRARDLRRLLRRFPGIRTLRLDIGGLNTYAPHPRNRSIGFRNPSDGRRFVTYSFEDIPGD